MTKTISTDQTSANLAQILEILAESPTRLDAFSKRISAESSRKPLGKEERSFVEVLAHLIHCEARSSEAIYLALLAEEPLFPDIHPERDWGKLLRYDLLDFTELLAYFKIRRKVLLRVLSGLTEAKWSRSVQEEGKKRKESVYWKARTIVMHELDHIEDLEKKLSKF